MQPLKKTNSYSLKVVRKWKNIRCTDRFDVTSLYLLQDHHLKSRTAKHANEWNLLKSCLHLSR